MAWTNIPSDQRAYVRDIETDLAALGRMISPATIYSTTQPTEAQINAAWSAKYPPAYAPDDYETMQWVDPATNTLKNHFMRAAPSTALVGQKPLVSFQTAPIPYTKLGEIYIDDAGGAATLTFSTIDQTYTDLYLYMLMRSSAAALTGAVSLRINGNAAAIYGYHTQGANTASISLVAEGASQAGIVVSAPGNTSHRSFYYEGLVRFMGYSTIVRPIQYHLRGTALTGAALVQATSSNFNLLGIFNQILVPMTSLSIVGTTGWISGTRFVLFGV